MTQSFSNFVGASPPQDNLLLARLVQEARQGGTRGRLAINQLRRLPGGREALQAVLAPAPPPPAPAPPPVAAAPPAPAPMAPPPQASPSFFDQTLGRGIGAVGRGVLGVGRFVQPVTTPVLENLGKAIETGMSGAVSTVGAVTPGDFMGLESNLAEERARRGIQSSLPKFVQASPLFTLESLIKGNAAKELQAQAAAWRATDMPSTRLNALPGQGIPLPGGKRLDEIDVGVKGAFELLPELALGIATGGGSAAGGLARRTATSAANVLGADIAMLGAKGALGAGRAATKGAKAVMPSGSTAKQADAAARGAGAIDQLPVYEGEAWRTPSGFWQDKGTTAGDVVRYERDELGNVETFSHVTDDMLRELDQYPAEDIVWVGRDREVASLYDQGVGMENVTQSVAGGRVIADIPDGTLILRPGAKKKTTPTTPATGTAAAVEPKQLSFKFIDDPDISPTTGKVSAADEAFEVNQTKAVELPAGYSPGLIEDLVPKIVSPDVVRRAVEKSKKLLKAVKIKNDQLEPSTLPGMAVSAVIKAAAPRISSTSNRLIQDVRGQLTKRDASGNRVFEFSNDDMRVENIQGISGEINPRTGKLLEPSPTVADIAQDYGAYEPFLTDAQKAVMENLRVRAEGLAADLEQFGFTVGYKAELGDNGFFISRGPTQRIVDNAGEVVEAPPTEKRIITKEGFEKERTRHPVTNEPLTQVEMIQGVRDPNNPEKFLVAPQKYLPVWDEFGQ